MKNISEWFSNLFTELLAEGSLLEGYTWWTIAILAITLIVFAFIYDLKKYNLSFGTQVLIGLGTGIAFGTIITLFLKNDASEFTPGVEAGVRWLQLIGNTFTGLLKMIVVPLIFVMVSTAIINMPTGSNKIRGWITRIISSLVIFSLIGAVVGIACALIFNLDASSIVSTDEISGRVERLQEIQESTDKTLVGLLNSFIPGNPFADLSGARDTSMIGVVIFAALIGFGGYIALVKDPKSGNVFKNVMNSIKDVIMVVVNAIIKLTPYGVFAIIARTVSITDFTAIRELGKFVGASYLAIIITFIILLVPLVLSKLNPVTYIKKAWETLVFAFSSRSSAATVPKTYATQSRLLGVDDGLASLSSSLGASIGQVG